MLNALRVNIVYAFSGVIHAFDRKGIVCQRVKVADPGKQGRVVEYATHHPLRITCDLQLDDLVNSVLVTLETVEAVGSVGVSLKYDGASWQQSAFGLAVVDTFDGLLDTRVLPFKKFWWQRFNAQSVSRIIHEEPIAFGLVGEMCDAFVFLARG